MTFSISIRNPSHGWIDVDLRLGEQRFELPVSHVANDPVRELAELALFIARAERGSARVTFWIEPAGYELCAMRGAVLNLVLSYSENAFRTLWDPTVVLEKQVDPFECTAAILDCLRAARPTFAAAVAADPRVWCHPFPEAVLLQLEAALA